MKFEDARALALEAASRGWISPEEVWDVACRWAQAGDKATLVDLFPPSLGADRLASLLPVSPGPRSSPNAETMGFLTEQSEPPGAVSDPQPAKRPSASPPGMRYHIGQPLGAGGVGVVTSALDRTIGRVVAVKTLKQGVADGKVVRRFIEEAHVTAQLEHPNIVPVYDMGTLPDGQPYYTMRVVKRTSLRDLLHNPASRDHWPLARLLGAFVQICRALAYAHSRNILHRDIKPENVLLGDFGEVYLADWGLAKSVKGEALAHARPTNGTFSDTSSSQTGGTPGYMAPEVLGRGDHTIDQRTDLFPLGVMLYEILTGQHPFEVPGNVAATLLNTCEKTPKRPRELNPACPLLLDDLCVAMLAKDKAGRPKAADDVASEIEAFLEGAKERERRRVEAQRLCDRAKDPVQRFQRLEVERKRAADLAEKVLKEIKGWESVDRKRAGWALEDRAVEAEREAGRALAEAVELYTKALGYDAESENAHAGLADLYWSRARAAEAERRSALQVYYEALVTDHDQGKYVALLRADARLSLRSNPSGANVIVYRYAERDRVLVGGDERYLGRTPLDGVRLDPGTYLVILKAPGFRDVRYPVAVTRGAHHDGEVNLYREDEIGEGFIYVPASVAILGGDEDAYGSLPRQEVLVPDFAVARFPVTVREYCAFLDHLQTAQPSIVEKRALHDVRGSEGLVVHPDASGRWTPDPVFIEGEARKLFPAGEGHEWNIPTPLVDWFDAAAFCRWRSERDGVEIRLPAEVEWEKAARGVDGRFYPWGDHFDPTFCLMRESRPFTPQPEPVGTFTTDESPYGVRDMAGGMREWVADIHGEKSAAELAKEPEPPPGTARGESSLRMLRSGNWLADAKWARSASRNGDPSLLRGTGLGFRCAKTLPRRER
jgi:serine/threonine protein kinase/formylglycine-generating enzyme required for sulfatase activity